MEKKISVDKTKCIHCGLCVKDCMSYALQMGPLQMPEYPDCGKDRCLYVGDGNTVRFRCLVEYIFSKEMCFWWVL